MLDCFASSCARFKLSCVFVFFVFLLEPAATKAMTSLRMRELHFFLTQSSCQSERSLIHVIILSHKKLCKKKKKKYCKKTKTFFVKHLLFSHYSSARTSKLLLSLLSFFSEHFNTLSTMLGTWVTMSWCKYFCKFLDKVDKLNVWARVCVCVCMIYIYSIYEYIILWSVEPWMNRRMWQGVGRL